MTLLRGLVPAVVRVAETFDGRRVLAPLLADEEPFVATAAWRRRREFANGRACARAAMARLGVPAVPIPVGPFGAPVWPDGVVGSITHSDAYCAGAVALRRDGIRALGVDAEVAGPLPDGVLDLVCGPRERADVDRLAREFPGVAWGRICFCAKESLAKAWYPLTGRWLDPQDALVVCAPNGTFTAETPSVAGGPANPARLRGRWVQEAGYCVTALVVGNVPSVTTT